MNPHPTQVPHIRNPVAHQLHTRVGAEPIAVADAKVPLADLGHACPTARLRHPRQPANAALSLEPLTTLREGRRVTSSAQPGTKVQRGLESALTPESTATHSFPRTSSPQTVTMASRPD